MFTDELHIIYKPFTKCYKHQSQLNNQQSLNKWFVNSEITIS